MRSVPFEDKTPLPDREYHTASSVGEMHRAIKASRFLSLDHMTQQTVSNWLLPVAYRPVLSKSQLDVLDNAPPFGRERVGLHASHLFQRSFGQGVCADESKTFFGGKYALRKWIKEVASYPFNSLMSKPSSADRKVGRKRKTATEA